MMSMTAIEIFDLVVKVDGYPLMNGLTLTVEEEEKVGIVGDFHDAMSVMNVLSGISIPDSGEIWIYNMPPRQAFQRGLIGYIHQPSTLADTPSNPILLVIHTATSQAHTQITIHPLIEISNKLIYNNYKFISLDLKRRNRSL